MQFIFPKMALKPAFAMAVFLLLSAALCAAPEEITVIGKAAPSDLTTPDLHQYTGFAKSIERESFAYQFTSMDNVLKQANTVQVKQTGGLGSYSSVSLRGSSGKQVNMFLDGMLLNSAFSGASNIQLLPSVLIEQVTVFPDFTPVNLGNANIGGAVNFTSRDIKPDELGGQLQLGFGSFGSYQQQLTGFANVDGWQLMGAYQRQKADNDFSVDEMIFRSNEPKRQNDSYQSDNGFIKLGKQFSDVNWQLYAQAGNSNKHLATVSNQNNDNAFLDNKTRRLQTILDYSAGNWLFSHRFFYATEAEVYSNEIGTVALKRDEIETQQEALGVFNAASVFIGAHELIASLDLRQDDIIKDDRLVGVRKTDGQRQTAVLALADHYQATDNWLITVTGRNYWLDDDVNFVSDNQRYQKSQQHQALAIGTQYQPLEFLLLKTNVGKSVRIPYLSEQYGSGGLFEGNRYLKPETANSFDAGFVLAFAKWQFEAAGFYRDITDGIYMFYNNGIGKPNNIGESKLLGGEAELAISPTEWFEWRASTVLMDSENLSKVKNFKGKKLPGIYHVNYGTELIFKGKLWRFRTDYQYYDELHYSNANAVKADSQNMINSSLSFFIEPIVLNFTVRNWLDENFLDFNQMPTPGRSFWATITLNF